MTELYTHQRPLQVFEPHAIDLHWGHSILEEPTFLAPWSAIDQAADLALEFGEPSHIVVTNFALPSSKRMSMRSKSVSFAEHVQVFPGKDVVQKFHAEWTCLNDRDQDADAVGVPHYVYAGCYRSHWEFRTRSLVSCTSVSHFGSAIAQQLGSLHSPPATALA